MHLEEFARGNSPLHRLDPRIKLPAALLWSCLIATAGRLAMPVCALGCGLALVCLARLPARELGIRFAIANSFIALLWLTLPFSLPGDETLFSIGPLRAGQEGLLLALRVTLKCNAILLAVTALLGTSTIFALTHAMRRLGMPEKLAQIFFFAFRYFQTMHAEYLRLREAMRARGFRARTSLHTYRSCAHLMGMLLVRSLNRAERVREAMLCRGYQGKLQLFGRFALTWLDMAFSILFLLLCGALFRLD